MIGAISLEVFGHWRNTVLGPTALFEAAMAQRAEAIGLSERARGRHQRRQPEATFSARLPAGPGALPQLIEPVLGDPLGHRADQVEDERGQLGQSLLGSSSLICENGNATSTRLDGATNRRTLARLGPSAPFNRGQRGVLVR